VTFPDYAALVVAGMACVTDIRTRRIPNVLTLGAAAGACGHFLAADGLSGLGWAMAGWTVGLLMFLPLFLLRGLGGGDVKLLAALGAWLGPGSAVWLALYSALAGGPLAVVVALSKGYLRRAVGNLWDLLMFWRVAGVQAHPTLTLDVPGTPRLPYAVPIAVGLVATLWLRR
jgi:prepilin peptidase CpaA